MAVLKKITAAEKIGNEKSYQPHEAYSQLARRISSNVPLMEEKGTESWQTNA
jgi:hypothetical protein